MQAGAIAVFGDEGAEQAADGDALCSLAAGTDDQDLLAYGGPGQPASQQFAALNPNPGMVRV